ncbi:outer dense fiber protein 4 isoform X3 [Tamandua tetradactyla]|uniref:outer dense fiber protein 4 isoform X3 n=1 Tax=Tamandua tetradactyla TaxID=48850 RepID=UPI0040540E46
MAPCQNATQGKKIAHNTHQTSQVLASELSLAAFILLLITVFSKKWLCLSGSRFYQRWPANISASIHLSAHIMTMGPLQICSSRSCFNLENGKLVLIFSTLILFPINLWIFELKRNLSIPIGWSYFIGWLVLILYVICAILCHFNQKSFWCLDLKGPSDTVSCSRSCGSARDTQKKEQNVSAISSTQAEILKPAQKKKPL